MYHKVSVVVPFRNRPFKSLKNCIDSTSSQLDQSDELIVVDYGSTAALSAEIAAFIDHQPLVKYDKVCAEGLLFNKAHALNIALRKVSGDFFMVCDADVVLGKDFITSLKRIVNPNSFFNYKCYYLPKGFDVSGISHSSKAYNYELSSENGKGLLIAPTKILREMNGYDEYFRLWGNEDLDMFRRLKNKGLQHSWLTDKAFSSFHQWHPHGTITIPFGWYSVMQERYKKNEYVSRIDQPDYGRYQDRPLLDIVRTREFDTSKKFEISWKMNFSYNILNFLELVKKTKRGDYLYIEENRPQERKIKKILEKLLNARISTEKISGTRKATTQYKDVYEFFFFFVLQHEHEIADYFFEYDADHFSFFVMK
jgi:glycosyltransferase involved in cell wall biosynthesis